MTGWEYLIVSLPAFGAGNSMPGQSASVDLLNHEGRAGWEAVGMSPLDGGGVAVLLKRRSDDDHEARRGRPTRPS